MEVKHLMNVNESALPKSIRREYNKIYSKFRGGEFSLCKIIGPFEILYDFQRQGKLFENEIDEEIITLISDEKFSEFCKDYHIGFNKGYNEFDSLLTNLTFKDHNNNIRINRVFNGVYNKFSRLKPYLIPIENESFLLIKLHLYEFGFETGTFVKCWDIILNNHNLFKEIFDLHYAKKEIVSTSNITKDKVNTFENNFDKVDESVKELRKLFSSIDDLSQQIDFYFSVSLHFLLKYRWYQLPEEAVSHCQFHMHLAGQTGNSSTIAMAITGSAFVHLWREEIAESRILFTKAIAILDEKNYGFLMICYTYMAIGYRMQNNVSMTELWSKMTIEKAEKTGNKVYQATSTANMKKLVICRRLCKKII